jgi:hypothetical protein
MSAKNHAFLIALALAPSLALSPACGSSSYHTHPDPTLFEAEPNGNAWNANFIGPLRPGDVYVVRGHVTELGPDVFDGFAFFSETPVEVEFILTADNPAADLDLCVYDPFIEDFVACFENPWNPETGFIDVYDPGVDFHLVVSSFALSSSYTLEVIAHPMSFAPAATTRIAPASKVRHESRRTEFWKAYATAPEPIAAASEVESRVAMPGEWIGVDLDTGEIVRRPTARIDDTIWIGPGEQ